MIWHIRCMNLSSSSSPAENKLCMCWQVGPRPGELAREFANAKAVVWRTKISRQFGAVSPNSWLRCLAALPAVSCNKHRLYYQGEVARAYFHFHCRRMFSHSAPQTTNIRKSGLKSSISSTFGNFASSVRTTGPQVGKRRTGENICS